MRSRRRGARLIVWLLATGAAFAGLDARAQTVDGFAGARFIEQREQFTPAGGAVLDLRYLITSDAASQAPRLVNTTHAALSLLADWFGPPPSRSLTIAAVPWRDGASGDVRAGVAVAPVRWLAPVRDQGNERSIIAALVRQYWAGGSPTPFESAVNIYLGTRAIHEILEGSNFAAPRFFGGAVSFPLRSVLLSAMLADPRPRYWGFVELEHGAHVSEEARRIVPGLQTLERYVGWPTMLQALARIRTDGAQRTAAAFAQALADARGTDIAALVTRCLTPGADFQYVLDDLQSRPVASGMFETTVKVRRLSTGQFPAVPILVRFDDRTEIRDSFDGTAAEDTLVYSAKSAASGAWIDPDVMLLLDRNRGRHAIVHDAPVSRLGVRLALHWLTWLQNAMLSYTAIV